MPMEEVSQIGRYLNEVIFHEHGMIESSVAWNAKTTNHRSSTLPLPAGLKFSDEMQQDEVIDIVVKEHILYVKIIRLGQ